LKREYSSQVIYFWLKIFPVTRLVAREWLDLHKVEQREAYLAEKSVLTSVSRSAWVAPPAPALYAHNAALTRFGAMAFGILSSGRGSSGGFVETADSGSLTLMMFREG
jgi:hypothetical protein